MNVVPLAAMLLLGPMSSASQADNGTSGLRVMTFNVLHSSIRNVVGTWQIRRPRVVRTIRTASPDVACLQEVSDRQLADLARDLPEYEVVGSERSGASSHFSWCMAIAGLMTTLWLLLKRSQSGSRLLAVVGILSAAGAIVAVVALFAIRFIQGDFVERGERCPILVRRDRLALERHGSFWDSGEPHRPGSKLPGSPSPHVVTWAGIGEPSWDGVHVPLGRGARRPADRLRSGQATVARGRRDDHRAAEPAVPVRSLSSGRDSGRESPGSMEWRSQRGPA